ncbi:DUF2158 domain-containing protein [Ramlibacter montanisoli]|uniref:DUF2158 domain-containing protein n=1 Tax=Ramlibacter montanisoli TaxID=2732512 RepID=A0A849KMD9_9BURK|nr:DUF2158 domain-containing protein [Ramlibacter montanisoli]NNU45511.1 DUF2158 domain-containing protein [Ramlibacter montanisoli]
MCDQDNKALGSGMTVVLRSGGPRMVIRAVSGDQAYCEWLSGDVRRQGTFALSTLVPAEAEKNEAEGRP